ncbi:MAG: hypothetical protein AB7L36_13300, partial [Sphingomonadaceae bacterium]
MTIDAASAKVRGGGPIDEAADYELPVWAGTIPVVTALGQAIDDGRLAAGAILPHSVTAARSKRCDAASVASDGNRNNPVHFASPAG